MGSPPRRLMRQKLISTQAVENPQQLELAFNTDCCDKKLIEEEEETTYLLMEPIALAASNGPDMHYYHQAIEQHDSEEFIKVIVKEINGHVKGEHWQLVKRLEVQKGARILDLI
eukprot:15148279-Ditylum_brightwellii.AAC.2